MSCCHLDRDTPLLLFLRLVHEVGELEASLVIDLCLSLVLLQLMVREYTVLEEDLP